MTRARDLADFNLDGKAVTINESSADLDFRVEGNGNANAFFVQGSDDFIGIGTGTPKKKVHIQDTTSDGMIILDMNGTTTDHQICFAQNYQSGSQSGGNYYAIGVDGSENKLVFAFDANSQASLSADAKMTMNSSGVLSVPNGIELGLSFDAAASNTLDDYEEGTWTATFTGSSTTATGRYVKVGGQVFVTVYGNTLNVTSSVTGTVGGLPFTNNGPYTVASITHDTYTNNSYNAYVQESGTTMIPIQDGTVSGAQTVVGNPKYIMISAVYYTTS